MAFITVLIEYEDKDDQPAFSAGMKALGGKVVIVQFGDLFDENEKLQDNYNELDANTLI